MSTYSIPNINNKPAQLADLGWNTDIRFDPDDSRPIYIGLNVANGASQDATDWKVYRFTYDGVTTNVTRIQVAYGSWTGRAGLAW